MMTRENAARKIRSLTKLAARGSGATPDEAATAKSLIRQMMRDYDLTPADVRATAPHRPQARAWPFRMSPTTSSTSSVDFKFTFEW